MDFLDYPRYDKETLLRKCHAVLGEEQFMAGVPLTDGEWKQVFDLCEIEYRFRRIPIVSTRTMHRLEAMAEHQELSDRYKRKSHNARL